MAQEVLRDGLVLAKCRVGLACVGPDGRPARVPAEVRGGARRGCRRSKTTSRHFERFSTKGRAKSAMVRRQAGPTRLHESSTATPGTGTVHGNRDPGRRAADRLFAARAVLPRHLHGQGRDAGADRRLLLVVGDHHPEADRPAPGQRRGAATSSASSGRASRSTWSTSASGPTRAGGVGAGLRRRHDRVAALAPQGRRADRRHPGADRAGDERGDRPRGRGAEQGADASSRPSGRSRRSSGCSARSGASSTPSRRSRCSSRPTSRWSRPASPRRCSPPGSGCSRRSRR